MKLNGIVVSVIIAIMFGSLSATAKASDYEEIGREAKIRITYCVLAFTEHVKPLSGAMVRHAMDVCGDIVARDLALKDHSTGRSLIRDGEIE